MHKSILLAMCFATVAYAGPRQSSTSTSTTSTTDIVFANSGSPVDGVNYVSDSRLPVEYQSSTTSTSTTTDADNGFELNKQTENKSKKSVPEEEDNAMVIGIVIFFAVATTGMIIYALSRRVSTKKTMRTMISFAKTNSASTISTTITAPKLPHVEQGDAVSKHESDLSLFDAEALYYSMHAKKQQQQKLKMANTHNEGEEV